MRFSSKKIAAVNASESLDLCELHLRIPNELAVESKKHLDICAILTKVPYIYMEYIKV